MGVHSVLENMTFSGWSLYIQTSEHHISQWDSLHLLFFLSLQSEKNVCYASFPSSFRNAFFLNCVMKIYK